MEKLSQLNINDKAIIKKITAKEPIKGRLAALGILKGSNIKVLKHTLAKQTWDVMCNNTKVGLREEEADNILVEKIDE
jgi:Fe2+ transport system protein FeoA